RVSIGGRGSAGGRPAPERVSRRGGGGMAPGFGYRFRAPRATPDSRGGKPPASPRTTETGLPIEPDVATRTRHGPPLYADVFRAVDEKPAPPLIAWTPYGKHVPNEPERFPNCEINPAHVSNYAAFEGPDSLYWVPRGYAVVVIDKRGNWYSEGKATFLSPD